MLRVAEISEMAIRLHVALVLWIKASGKEFPLHKKKIVHWKSGDNSARHAAICRYSQDDQESMAM